MGYEKISIYKDNLDQEKETFKKKYPKEAKFGLEYIRLLGIGEINKGFAVSRRRQIRCIELLKIFIRTIDKPIGSLTKKHMQEYIEKLTNDKVGRIDKKPYSDSVKSDYKIFLKSYLKFRLPKVYTELTDWFDVRRKKRTADALSEKEVEVLLNNCKNPEQRFIIAILFDSGARIEEFLNVRFEDITPPTDNFPYYKINFKQEYSKTSGRDIGMYWKNSTQIIKDYLATLDKSYPNAQIIPKTYNAMRLFISRFGRQTIGKRIHAHLLRKSSSTYYADKLNRQQLCVRYGWDFSSKMPDVYIKRAGVEEGRVKEAVYSSDLNSMRKENEEIKTKLGLSKEQLDNLSIENSSIREVLDTFKKEIAEIKELKKKYALAHN